MPWAARAGSACLRRFAPRDGWKLTSSPSVSACTSTPSGGTSTCCAKQGWSALRPCHPIGQGAPGSSSRRPASFPTKGIRAPIASWLGSSPPSRAGGRARQGHRRWPRRRVATRRGASPAAGRDHGSTRRGARAARSPGIRSATCGRAGARRIPGHRPAPLHLP